MLLFLTILFFIGCSLADHAHDHGDGKDQEVHAQDQTQVSDWVVVSDWEADQWEKQQPAKSLKQPTPRWESLRFISSPTLSSRVGFFDVNANYAQGLSMMVLFIFAFWLTVDFILGDVNILKILGVTPLVREVRHLVEGFDAQQVPNQLLESAIWRANYPKLGLILIINNISFTQAAERTEEVLTAINNFQRKDFSQILPSLWFLYYFMIFFFVSIFILL